MKVIQHLMALCLTALAPAAFGVVTADTNCLNGGCLQSGWVTRDFQRGVSTYIRCTHQDCMTYGWTVESPQQGAYQTTYCRAGGCFDEGWDTYDDRSGQYLGGVACTASPYAGPACLTGGWVDRPQFSPPVYSTCVGYDCAVYGWHVSGPNFSQEVSCMRGGCFERGWIVDSRR